MTRQALASTLRPAIERGEFALEYQPLVGMEDGRLRGVEAVLDAVYAAFTKGWSEVGEASVPEMADEAVWLGRLIVSLLPAEPEAKGMLALMLYAESRRAARTSLAPLNDATQRVPRW